MKHKNNGMFLLNTDIEILNKRYDALYKNVKESPYLSKAQIDRECEILLAKYNFEIEELNSLREVEYRTQQAKIRARKSEEIPWRRCWLRHLLLLPVTNRAQDNIEEEAAQNAEMRFTFKEKQLANRAATLYGEEIKGLSPRKRNKLLKKYIPNRYLRSLTLEAIAALNSPSEELNAVHEEHDAAQHGNVNAQTAAEQLLEAIVQAAENAAPEEAFEQPEPPATVMPSEQPKPNRKRKRRSDDVTPEEKEALRAKLRELSDDTKNTVQDLEAYKKAPSKATESSQIGAQKLATIRSTAPGQLPGQIALKEITGSDSQQ